MQRFAQVMTGSAVRRYLNLDNPNIDEILLFCDQGQYFVKIMDDERNFTQAPISQEEFWRIQNLLEEKNYENEPSTTERSE